MRYVYVQPRFGEPTRRAIPVPRGGRHRLRFDRYGARWLVVRTWYGRIVHRVPVTGYW